MPWWRRRADEPLAGRNARRRRGLRPDAGARLPGPDLHPDHPELDPAHPLQPRADGLPEVRQRRDGPVPEPVPAHPAAGADGAGGSRPQPDRGDLRADHRQLAGLQPDPRVKVDGPAAALATAGVVVAIDQAIKQLAATRIAPFDKVDVLPGLQFTNTRNTGVAFGALEGGGLIVAILIGVSLSALIAYFVANRGRAWLWLP